MFDDNFKKALKIMSLALTVLIFSLSQARANDIQTVEYTCNEGIPLIVEYINTQTTSIAVISHDSSPRITLDSVPSGSGAQYSNGNWVLHVKGKTALVGTQGQTDDECKEVAQNTRREGHNAGITYPRKAKSWGGIMRSGPGTKFDKLDSIKQGEWVTLLEPTTVQSNSFPWFKIKYRGRTGYQWGGIICSVGEQVPGTFNKCKAD